LLFLGLFLVIPLFSVFAKALEGGLSKYWEAVTEPDARRNTVDVADAAVGPSMYCLDWLLPGRLPFDFRGKDSLSPDRLARQCFAGDPRMLFVLLFGAQDFRPWLMHNLQSSSMSRALFSRPSS
jgi:sulfate transport system permease protein